MGKIERSRQAARDLVEIWCYIADDSSRAADAMKDRVEKVCKTPARTPMSGRSRQELAPGIRSFPVGDDLIFYQPIAGGIVVLRVLRGYRNLADFFEND